MNLLTILLPSQLLQSEVKNGEPRSKHGSVAFVCLVANCYLQDENLT